MEDKISGRAGGSIKLHWPKLTNKQTLLCARYEWIALLGEEEREKKREDGRRTRSRRVRAK